MSGLEPSQDAGYDEQSAVMEVVEEVVVWRRKT